MRLGMGEILLILAVVLLIFGPKKLPQLGEALGKGIRSFRKATTEREEEPPAEQARLPEGVSPVQTEQQKPVASARR
ncbi:MAG: twin-arginine translocase TatA/TatE family subunit [Deltaproteobacteria bacterium]|nr:twin-arginine translocase TatA/TatE family subunit [Deltaproteobacteria bacterium]